MTALSQIIAEKNIKRVSIAGKGPTMGENTYYIDGQPTPEPFYDGDYRVVEQTGSIEKEYLYLLDCKGCVKTRTYFDNLESALIAL